MKNGKTHKAIFAGLILITLSLTSCAGKWTADTSHMPDDWREEHERILQENLDILAEGDSMAAAFEVAFRYHQLGDYKKAIKYYEQVLEYNVNHISTLNNLAAIYEEVGEYETAAAYVMGLYMNNQSNQEAIRDTVRILLLAGDALNAQNALDNYNSLVLTDELEDEEKRASYEAVITTLQADIDAWLAENPDYDMEPPQVDEDSPFIRVGL